MIKLYFILILNLFSVQIFSGEFKSDWKNFRCPPGWDMECSPEKTRLFDKFKDKVAGQLIFSHKQKDETVVFIVYDLTGVDSKEFQKAYFDYMAVFSCGGDANPDDFYDFHLNKFFYSIHPCYGRNHKLEHRIFLSRAIKDFCSKNNFEQQNEPNRNK